MLELKEINYFERCGQYSSILACWASLRIFFFGILEKKLFLPTYLDLAEVCISTPLRPGAGAN